MDIDKIYHKCYYIKMGYIFEPNPFKTKPDQKAANLERVRAEREAKDEIRGFGSDGPIVEAVSDFGLRAMDVGEQAIDGFINAAEEAATIPGTLREKLGSGPSA